MFFRMLVFGNEIYFISVYPVFAIWVLASTIIASFFLLIIIIIIIIIINCNINMMLKCNIVIIYLF
jgi:hypothetical protein